MRTLTRAAPAVVILLAATACSGLPGGGSNQPSPPAASASTASSAPPSSASSSAVAPTPSAPTSDQPTPADPNQPSAGDQLGTAVATRTSADDGTKVKMVLYPVLRNGRTSTVTFTLSSPAKRTSGFQVGQFLSDGNYDAIEKTAFAVDGLQLVDGKHAKLYLVASDGRGQCLCSRGLEKVFLSENVPVYFSATFAAPPADVVTVDLRVPNFGTVHNVPVR